MTESLPENKPETSDLKQCKFCAEEIKSAARICRFCNRDQEEELPHLRPEHINVGSQSGDEEKATVPLSERKCSFCREDIKRDAIICSHCGKNLSPKSTGAAYLLLLFLGGIGAHKFYLMKRGAGLFYLSCFLFAFLTYGLTMIPVVILLFVELFTLPSQVDSCNKRLIGLSDHKQPASGFEAVDPSTMLAGILFIVVVILGCIGWRSHLSRQATELREKPPQNTADYQNSESAELSSNDHSPAVIYSTTFPVGVTVTRYEDSNEYQCHYDRIKIVSQIGRYSPRMAPDGSVFLVLFYDVKALSKSGSSSAMMRTEMFEIVTSDKIEYAPDQDARRELSTDKSILTSGEDTEAWRTEFQPGIEKRLATVFQIPIEQLSKDPVLIVPESYGMAKRIPLANIAKAYGGSGSRELSETSVSEANPADLVFQMIQNVQSDNRSFETALSALRSLPKPVPCNAQKAEASNPIGLKALKEKDYSKAVSAFLESVQADPSTARYVSNLGFAEMYAGDLDNAEKHTIQSLALAPDRRVAWNNLGQIKAKQDKQDEAIACFMIAYRLSNGESLSYLKSLYADDDPRIREVGRLALEKLGQTSTTGTTSNRP